MTKPYIRCPQCNTKTVHVKDSIEYCPACKWNEEDERRGVYNSTPSANTQVWREQRARRSGADLVEFMRLTRELDGYIDWTDDVNQRHNRAMGGNPTHGLLVTRLREREVVKTGEATNMTSKLVAEERGVVEAEIGALTDNGVVLDQARDIVERVREDAEQRHEQGGV